MTQATETPRRIVLVRLSALGDIVHTMPIACALRRALPDVHLTWVVQSGGAPLLQGHPAVDRVIAVPRRWMTSMRGIRRIHRQLHEQRFDLAIDGQGLAKSAALAWLSGAPRRIGFARPWGRELSPWFATETVDTREFGHVIERNLRLLKPLGIEVSTVEFRMPSFPAARRTLEAKLADAGQAPGGVVLNVGAAWASKRWPPVRYGQLARRLAETRGVQSLIVFGGTHERQMAEQAVAASGGAAALAPAMSLQELTELARAAQIFVGSDTGPLHIAAAVDTPCVGLYGPFPADRHGPYGPRHLTVQRMCLTGSVRQRRRASAQSMEAIDVESVYAACCRQLDCADESSRTVD